MKYCFLLVFLFLLRLGFAQSPNYIVVDKSKGLPSNAVYRVFQDSKGFIWITTEEGLCRYDGYHFQLFSNRHQTSKAGSEIREDVYGRIWYENFDGYLYYVENDSLKALNQRKSAGFLLYGLSAKTLFVVSDSCLELFDLKTLHCKKRVPYKREFLSFSIFSGNRFFLCCDSIVVFDDAGLVQTVPKNDTLGNMLAMSDGGVCFYAKKKSSVACFRYSDTGPVPFLQLRPHGFIHSSSTLPGQFWFCTSAGAFAYSNTGAPVDHGMIFFPDNSISCVMKDRENNYWFGTTNKGLLFVADFSSRRYFDSIQTTRLEIMGDSLFFGTQNDEVWAADLQTMDAHPVFKGSSNHSVDILKAGDAYAPLFFTSDALGVLAKNTGVRRYAVAPKDCEAIAPGVYACAITGFCGLFFAENGPDHFWKHLNWGRTNAPISSSLYFGHMLVEGVRGKSVAYDSTSATIYFATNKGLFAVTRIHSTELKWKNQSIYFSKIVFYNNRLYGLSTQGDLVVMDAPGHFEKQNERFGIASEKLKGMRRCGSFLMLYSSDEVVIIDLRNPTHPAQHIATYTTDIYDVVLWKNKLLLSTTTGVLSFSLNELSHDLASPRFVLDAVLVNKISLATLRADDLSAEQNTIEIRYSILSFKTGFSYPLYYQINDKGWELCAADARSLQLASLTPGDYTIRFRLGDSEKTVAHIHFTINRPWWARWWALGLYALGFALLVFLIYKRNMFVQERKNKAAQEKLLLEKNLNQSILTSLKSQMNPHFFYNALNTIQSFIYDNDKQNAGIYLSKFSKLTRMILEMSEKESISLTEEMMACKLYLELEQARFSEDFLFTIELKGAVDADRLRIPPMLIQPYIENAVKHGLLHKKGAKIVHVVFELQEKVLLVSIDDNGIGRVRSGELNTIRKDKHKSFATEATQKRLELLNLGRSNMSSVNYIDKQDALGQATGTTVIIHIPIGNA